MSKTATATATATATTPVADGHTRIGQTLQLATADGLPTVNTTLDVQVLTKRQLLAIDLAASLVADGDAVTGLTSANATVRKATAPMALPGEFARIAARSLRGDSLNLTGVARFINTQLGLLSDKDYGYVKAKNNDVFSAPANLLQWARLDRQGKPRTPATVEVCEDKLARIQYALDWINAVRTVYAAANAPLIKEGTNT